MPDESVLDKFNISPEGEYFEMLYKPRLKYWFDQDYWKLDDLLSLWVDVDPDFMERIKLYDAERHKLFLDCVIGIRRKLEPHFSAKGYLSPEKAIELVKEKIPEEHERISLMFEEYYPDTDKNYVKNLGSWAQKRVDTREAVIRVIKSNESDCKHKRLDYYGSEVIAGTIVGLGIYDDKAKLGQEKYAFNAEPSLSYIRDLIRTDFKGEKPKKPARVIELIKTGIDSEYSKSTKDRK